MLYAMRLIQYKKPPKVVGWSDVPVDVSTAACTRLSAFHMHLGLRNAGSQTNTDMPYLLLVETIPTSSKKLLVAIFSHLPGGSSGAGRWSSRDGKGCLGTLCIILLEGMIKNELTFLIGCW